MSSFDSLSNEDLENTGRALAPAAVLSNLGIMIGVSIFIILFFNFFRPKHNLIYAPKVKYHKGEKAPPRISDSFLGWIPPLIHTKEDQIFDLLGLDAVAFLRFIRLCRQLFAGVAIIAGGILIPINILYSNGRKADILSQMTIRDVYSEYLWAHIAVVYLVTFLLLGLLFHHWKQMVELRRRWFTSDEYMNSLYSRTISIMNVPSKYRSNDGLRSILAATKMPYPITSVSMGRKLGILPDLIETHNETVRKFEAVLVEYLKSGRAARKRPTVTIGGAWGFGGNEHDAISYYTTKIKTSHLTISKCRQNIDARRAENYGFASLAATPYAHEVARRLHNKHPKSTDVDIAMNPKEINWKNMTLSEVTIGRRRLFGWLWMTLLCVFSLIPAALVSILAIMDVIARIGLIPGLQEWTESSPATYAIISGSLPPIVNAIWTYFLPKLMRRISKNMGAKTSGTLDRAVVARFFAFLVISQLVIFTMWGVLFISVSEVIALVQDRKDWKEILQQINRKLPGRISSAYVEQSNYWLKFLPLRGFLVVFDLAQLVNFLWISIKTRLWGRTPRDVRDWTQPPPFDYPVYYANLLFTVTVGLLFAPLAPLVSCGAAVVFLLSSFIYKYQLLFIFVTKVESGGRAWNMAVNRILVSAVLMQLLFCITIGLHLTFTSIQFYFTIPPLLFIIVFKVLTTAKFARRFRWYIPQSTEELQKAKVHTESVGTGDRRLDKRFGHPALYGGLLTPMLHENMIPLMPQILGSSTFETVTVDLKEYGGEKMSGVRVDGIVYASVSKSVLQYDPALYQRDLGDNWDRSSVGSSTLLSPMMSPSPSVMGTSLRSGRQSEYYAQGPIMADSRTLYHPGSFDAQQPQPSGNMPMSIQSNSRPPSFAGRPVSSVSSPPSMVGRPGTVYSTMQSDATAPSLLQNGTRPPSTYRTPSSGFTMVNDVQMGHSSSVQTGYENRPISSSGPSQPEPGEYNPYLDHPPNTSFYAQSPPRRPSYGP